MYYKSINDLPRTLQETLPPEAQSIYVDSYNETWNQYAALGKDEATCATAAHQIAWDAVNRQFTFVKSDQHSQWVRKGEEATVAKSNGRTEKKGFFARLGFGSR